MNALRLHVAMSLALLSRRTDVVFALGVSLIVGLLIIPLPTVVLDVLIAVNIGAAAVLLVVALMARRALDVSTFPSLLLVTTLFRLGLNVSTTRGILAQGDAGEVVRSFGAFVVRGDIVVGAVIFLVITVVQFLVIAKGAERVAEVGARFTLDAMPGKQMSIDAGLRSGAYTEEEAQAKRDELGRQSQLFGNMDGAMKFVKGDAIAGLIITALNLVAGFVIGALRYDMPFADALETYSLLTIGDGLVTQIAALLVTISAGVLVTRVEGQDDKSNLGQDFSGEVLGSTKALYVAAVLMMALALAPGLPFMPFAGMAALLSAIASAPGFLSSMNRGRPRTKTEVRALRTQALERQSNAIKKKKNEETSPWVVPITLELGDGLSKALGFSVDEVENERIELLATLIPQLRRALHAETGVEFPGVRVRTFTSSAPRNGFVVRIKDVPLMQRDVCVGKLLALTPPRRLKKLGVAAEETPHPMGDEPVSLISEADRRVVKAAGVQVWTPAGVVALHLGSLLRDEATQFIGVYEVGQTIKKMEKAYPDLVKEVVPKVVSLAQLVEVLRRVVDEGVSIRDFKTILETLSEHGPYESDTLALSELVRAGLSRQIAHHHAGLSNRLPVLLLDAAIEDVIEGGITRTTRGSVLALDPEITRSIVRCVAKALEPMVQRGTPPVIVTSSRVRRLVRKIIELDLPGVPVLSFEELPPRLVVQPMGRASLAMLDG